MFSTKRVWHFGLLLVGLSTLLATQAQAAGVSWRTSLPAALQEAKRTRKPVFLDFAATWCGPCQLMNQHTFTDKRVIAELRKWVSVHVDVDKQEEVAERYNVEAMPTLIVVSPGGKVVSKTLGYHSANQLLTWLRANYAKARR